MKKIKNEADLARAKGLINSVPEEKLVKLQRIFENKCSTWLSIIPTNEFFFALSPDEFRDALKDSQACAMVAAKILIFVML